MKTVGRAGATAVVLALVAFAGLGVVRAVGSGDATTVQERVDAVSATIRCPTCQGLSIKDSPSILADGSRKIVAEQVGQGRTPDQIRQYFVERYGAFVLLSPDTGGPGLLVWLLPVLAVSVGGLWAWRWLRREPPGRPLPVTPAGAESGTDDETDGDALVALQAFRSGQLDPGDSAAGEALREALLVRIAAAEDDSVDAGAIRRADSRLGASYRRYRTRESRARARVVPARGLPRRAVTGLTVALLLLATGTALAVGVRIRGATDLATGDLPGGVPVARAAPGLAPLLSATRSRPDDPDTWVALGRAYDGAAQVGAAVAAYDRALRLRPEADDVALLRAGVLVRAGSAREALPTLERLGARYPEDPDTVLLLGLAQDKIGLPAATQTLRRFLAVAPDAPAAPAVRRLLQDS